MKPNVKIRARFSERSRPEFLDFDRHVIRGRVRPDDDFFMGLCSTARRALLKRFEILVSFLQAFIFTILTAVYIGGAMHPEH